MVYNIFNSTKKFFVERWKEAHIPLTIKGKRYSMKETRERYSQAHKNQSWLYNYTTITAFGDFIIAFREGSRENIIDIGYWLNDIILHNLDKNFEEIRQILFANQTTYQKFLNDNRTNYKTIPVVYINKTKSEVKKYLKLPS